MCSNERMRRAVLAVCLFGSAVLGCSLFRGAINDSPQIRWWLFSNFGASQLCPEMLKRSAPLRLAPAGNVIGRLFPNGCQHRVDEQRRTISIEFMGTGYAWTPIAGRVGFAAHAAIEYRPDFSLQSDAMYVWARTERLIFPPQFRVGSIENRMVNWAQNQTPMGYLTNTFGSQITSSQLSSGFTVVRTDAGDAFSLGILVPPNVPARPSRRVPTAECWSLAKRSKCAWSRSTSSVPFSSRRMGKMFSSNIEPSVRLPRRWFGVGSTPMPGGSGCRPGLFWRRHPTLPSWRSR